MSKDVYMNKAIKEAYGGVATTRQPYDSRVASFLLRSHNKELNMSFKAMSWAAKAKTNTPVQKLVLLLLADRCSDNGVCFPSIERIADDACMSSKSVIENIKKLAAHGFISVHKNSVVRDNGIMSGGRHNVYVVHVGNYPLGKSIGEESSCCETLHMKKVHDIGEESSCRMVKKVHTNLSSNTINEPINYMSESDDSSRSSNSSNQKLDTEANSEGAKPKAQKKNIPPPLETVVEWARKYAAENNLPEYLVISKAKEAFEYYEKNMRNAGARTWKRCDGGTVKNWKLQIINNWFKKISPAKQEYYGNRL